MKITWPNVELVRVGRHAASTGVHDINQAHLADAVRAWNDRLLSHIPVSLGHVDPRHDGEPAVGWVENLRLSADGNTLIGDIGDVPESLEAKLARSYRSRSVDLGFGAVTPDGRTYSAIMTGLALLGVTRPAVQGLAPLVASLSAAEPDPVRLTLIDGVTDPVHVASLAAAAELGLTLPDTSTVPPRPPVPGDATNTASTPGGTVPFAELIRIRLGLAPDATDAEVEAKMADPATVLVEVPAVTPAPAAPAVTDAAPVIQPSISQVASPAPVVPPAGVTASTPAVPAAVPAGELVGAGASLSSALPAGYVVIDQASLAAMQTVVQERAVERRDQIITNALNEGRISIAQSGSFRAKLDENETSTIEFLGLLAPGVHAPAGQVGVVSASLSAGAGVTDDDKTWDDFWKSSAAPAV